MQDAVLEIELDADLRYRLRYGDLVEYENGRRKVAVKIGISNGVKAEVLEGLQPGDKVVLQ